MSLSIESVKRLIKKVGFIPQDGKFGIYYKCYTSHNNYIILVDFNSGRIIYDSPENTVQSTIKVWGRMTGNFFQAENFVVLECVDSLLEKGYAPECIELEKTYPSGHGRSGRLDILVKAVDGAPFLMIECKTWGIEFEKERRKMLRDGGQLFTYYTNDRAARYLCLYTSCMSDERKCQCAIVDVDSAWTSLSGVKEIYDHWNKNFKDNGIFDSYAAPYDVKHKALTYGKLETLKEEHSGKIYNQIMEILRHNAISDKPNAFNKLLNLFVCKIIDEVDKNPEDELGFQWLESDNDETLQLRLNDLYKKGMWRFLEIAVIDYEQQEVSDKLANIEDDTIKQWIMKMYTDTRLKKSPNFAFVEVQDDRTFELNAKVVREVVELLQVYKFRYEQKHEFLGNFFELLLNTSMKQEAGQFFTPVPITRFMISSLPLAELVQNRVNSRCDEPLPTVIDYACGSGHFLTEYMAQMQKIIEEKISLDRTSPRIKGLFQSWRGFTKFIWAKDSVYGIDLDNRLVKTAKVSAFFNGDGEANIVWANGLDSFTKSKTFRGKLVGAQDQDNGKFDILISNPPYSVDAFRSTIEYGNESFELYSGLTDNSSEIECLFVERMKQLLKVGGWAAVILPNSILTNSGIHAKAREIILKYFRVKAIVEAGANTFMKTNTSTVILFLERRNNDDHMKIVRSINRFFNSYEDIAVAGIENAFSTFVFNVYNGMTFEDYVSLFKGNITDAIRTNELYEDYLEAFGNDFLSKAIDIEKEKMLYFFLTYQDDIVLVKTGNKKEEKRFLGYEFSERRGHEGLHYLSSGTKLYDEVDSLNHQKVSSYIYCAFLKKRCKIDTSLKNNVFYGNMSDFIEYGTNGFDKRINLGKSSVFKNEIFPCISVQTVSISDVAEVQGGKRLPVGGHFSDRKTDYPYLRVSDFKNLSIDTSNLQYISAEQHEQIKKYTISSADVYISIAGTIGLVGIVPDSLDGANLTENAAKLIPKQSRINQRYLMYTMNSSFVQEQIRNAIVGLGTPKLSLQRIRSLRIPILPLDVQQAAVNEILQTETKEKELIEKINEVKAQITFLTEECYQSAEKLDKLKKFAHYATERINASGLTTNNYVGVDNLLPNVGGKRPSDFVPSSGSVIAYHSNNILISNIRPYLKKAWLANSDGGCSGDVLVLCIDCTIAFPEYVFLYISADRFFEYEMQNIGSNVKMPRADRRKVLDYQIPLPKLEEQKKVIEQALQYKAEIAKHMIKLEKVRTEKETILKKYLEADGFHENRV